MQLQIFETPKYYATDFITDKEVFEKATGIKMYVDGFGTAICGRTMLDVLKIDKELIRLHGEYMNEKKQSMNQFVAEKFGQDILFILHKWTTVPVVIETYYRLYNPHTQSYFTAGYNCTSENEMREELSFYGYLYDRLKQGQRKLPLDKMLTVCGLILEKSVGEPFDEKQDPHYFDIMAA